jgi:hypothetical protein
VWVMTPGIACFLQDIACFDTWPNVANVSLSEEHPANAARIGKDWLLGASEAGEEPISPYPRTNLTCEHAKLNGILGAS